MTVVVSIGDFKKKDAVAVLRELLVRAVKGEVAGLAFNVEFRDGRQKSGFTGKYQTDPREAVKVAHRMSQALNQVADLKAIAALDYPKAPPTPLMG